MSNDPFAPIDPNLKAPCNTTLILSEKSISLSGDSGKVKDENGNVVFQIEAKLMTLSDRRLLLDSTGKTIGQARRKKSLGLHPAYYLGTSDNDKRCTVKLKGTFNITKCDADIYMDDKVIGEVSGDWRAKSYDIRVNGTPVANVRRKRTMESTFMDADSYSIEIVKGVDTAFMILVTIAMDELYHD